MEVISNLADQELVSSIREGKGLDKAVRALYDQYFESLSWYVMNNSGSQQDAEDIFQDVVVSFIDLVQKDRFRGESTVKTFLYSLNRFAWLNELKRRGRTRLREEKFEQSQIKLEAAAEQEVMAAETRREVAKLVERLGETCRKILVMFYYEEKSMREILEELPYENEQVVRNKKYKCLKELEKIIEANPSMKSTLKTLLHE